MDSQEARLQISILHAHLTELWELIYVMPDPVQRGIAMSRVVDLYDKITFLQKIAMN
jgi:hypothetical protein